MRDVHALENGHGHSYPMMEKLKHNAALGMAFVVTGLLYIPFRYAEIKIRGRL
jgi:hypothetical protein